MVGEREECAGMHALLNRMLHVFVEDTYGTEVWCDVLEGAGLSAVELDSLGPQTIRTTRALSRAVETVLARSVDTVLEDVGTYLVSHPNAQSVRRLLRFCGTDFVDFLHSLEDLPDRIRLAVPSLSLPEIEVAEEREARFLITCRGPLPGVGHLLAGLLRAMADDYGTLALLEHEGRSCDGDRLRVTLVDTAFSEGRRFVLGAGGAAPLLAGRHP
ncbi:Haem-NO-binding [Roseivivax marinus]|nr:Haem-NO-binding [Roseivivax marinus]